MSYILLNYEEMNLTSLIWRFYVNHYFTQTFAYLGIIFVSLLLVDPFTSKETAVKNLQSWNHKRFVIQDHKITVQNLPGLRNAKLHSLTDLRAVAENKL